MPPRFDAILFDLDGTLLDSAPDIHRGANKALAARDLGQITLEQARGYVGHGAAIFITRLRAGLGLGEDLQAPLLAEFLDHYEHDIALTAPYPGTQDAMDRLAAAGLPLAVVTNKPVAPMRAVLDHFGWTPRFATALGGDSLPVRKPDPAPLLAAIAELGAQAPLFVGDSEVDAETAARAGVPFALFTPGYRKAAVETLPHMHAFDDFTRFAHWVLG